jgi:hypothetical protein
MGYCSVASSPAHLSGAHLRRESICLTLQPRTAKRPLTRNGWHLSNIYVRNCFGSRSKRSPPLSLRQFANVSSAAPLPSRPTLLITPSFTSSLILGILSTPFLPLLLRLSSLLLLLALRLFPALLPLPPPLLPLLSLHPPHLRLHSPLPFHLFVVLLALSGPAIVLICDLVCVCACVVFWSVKNCLVSLAMSEFLTCAAEPDGCIGAGTTQ